jgi:hypothetical protein
LPGAELLHRLLVGGQHFVDDRLSGAAVGDLLEALGFDDGVGRSLSPVPQRLEDLLGDGVGDGVVGDARTRPASCAGSPGWR